MSQIKFTESHMISILYNMLCSLNFLHSANVMHRDIKPANILVDEECGVKLCDFGLSRSLTEPKQLRPRQSRKEIAQRLNDEQKKRETTKRNLSNHVVSRWYRPPEIILVEKNYDCSVDIWSTGCILSELISCTSEYTNNGVSQDDRFLFTGSSCFPLSPSS